MIERLNEIEKRYLEIEESLTKPDIISDIQMTLKLTKEQSTLKEAYECYLKYKKVLTDIEEAKEMLKDSELGNYAKEELTKLEEAKVSLESELEILLLPKDPNDSKNVIMEIRGAAGGDEANIFAGDLYRMYTKYAERVGFKIEELTSYGKSRTGSNLDSDSFSYARSRRSRFCFGYERS